MDPIQLTIILVTTSLTILLIVLGIQVYLILKEIRISIQKANKMLDDAGAVTGTVSQGITSMSGFINGIRSGISLITSLNKPKEEKNG
jgi:hypothetical protein